VTTVFPKSNQEPLDLLGQCSGYYECPIDSNGKRLGPLVGYTAKYDEEHHWVGDIYANFAKLERHAPALYEIADRILAPSFAVADDPSRTTTYGSILRGTGFCGAPEGGKALANTLASIGSKQYIFPEKGKSELSFDRHEPESGESWWIVEDVCNNFSTTQQIIDLIRGFGASVEGVICFLNRSLHVDDEYNGLPVVSLVRKPIPQYRQDDPFVAKDVRQGNVVWHPKLEWAPLKQAMAAHR
jgi:hypothetical protein